MSTFKVTIEKLASLTPIEGADKIEQAHLESMAFSFVVKKGEFKAGDAGVYIPLDAIVPDVLLAKIGLVGKLSGGAKNRVKTVKLRGCSSQGLFLPTHAVLSPEELVSYDAEANTVCGKELTEHLGIVKYEPDDAANFNGNAKGLLPSFLSKYDIESAQRYKRDFEALCAGDAVFAIAEKLEGQNHCCFIKEDDSEGVCSRSLELKDEGDSLYWRTAREFKLFDFAREVKRVYNAKTVAIYSEQCGPGIQGNIYKLNSHKLFTFDVKVDDRWMAPEEFVRVTSHYGVTIAPVLHVGTIEQWLAKNNTTDLVQSSNGKSVLFDTLREGVVFKPYVTLPRIDRLYKIRSPQYLGETDNV